MLEKKNAETFSWFWLSKPFFQLKKLKIPTEVFGGCFGISLGFQRLEGMHLELLDGFY